MTGKLKPCANSHKLMGILYWREPNGYTTGCTNSAFGNNSRGHLLPVCSWTNPYLRHYSDDFSQNTQLPYRDLPNYSWDMGYHPVYLAL